MLETLQNLKTEAEAAIAAAGSEAELRDAEVRFLGRSGALTEILRGLKSLPDAEKAAAGKASNEIKRGLEEQIERKSAALKEARFAQLAETEWLDPTAPGLPASRGSLHPFSQFTREVEAIFAGLGFEVATGPEVEDDFHNFTALNIPADHPARDGHDTLYLQDLPNLLLRTQTSGVQIRTMESREPPIRVIAPGRVFRKDDFDATHAPAFHQIEGLMLDRSISLANMKAVIETAVRELLGSELEFRWRAAYFPFVEPGLELDARSPKVKGGRWLELLGCGMVHPKVLAAAGVDAEKWNGFAFGMGLDRLVMLRHGIADIRDLYQSDLRFLRQF